MLDFLPLTVVLRDLDRCTRWPFAPKKLRIFFEHTTYAVNKAKKILGMMNKTFYHMSVDLMKIIYTTYVRPHLEFDVSASCPYAKHDIDKLEKVQHRATRLVPALRGLEYEKRMDVLGITTLERRRIRGDLIQTYKLLNGIDKVTWTSEATFAIKDQNDYSINTRGHNMKLIREIVKSCEQRHNFYTNRVCNVWNALSIDVVQAPSLNSFKSRLNSEMNRSPYKFTY